MSKYGVFSGPYFSVFGPEKTPYLDIFSHSNSIAANYLTSIFTFPTVAIYREISNNEKLFKIKILAILSKFIKFYIQWSKIDQFWDDLTRFGALKDKRHNQCVEIASCWHFPRPTNVVLVFYSSSDTAFHVGNKNAGWDKNVHQKLQNYAKKEFLELFLLPKTEQKSKVDQNA